MARFTLIEKRGTGVEVNVPDRGPNVLQEVGDQKLIIDRVLVNRRGKERGAFVVRGTVLKDFGGGDIRMAFDATNKLHKGVINTQGVIRFSDTASDDGVTFAIVGGTRKFKNAHGTVTVKFVDPDTEFTYRVS